MARRTIDVVAAGPPSSDLYDPAASAWALAEGFAARGDSVQVAYPGREGDAPAPPGVTAVPFPAVTGHVGTFLGEAELAKEAGRRLRPTAEVVVRDPAGVGALGHHAGRRPVVVFVRSLVDDEDGPAGRSPASTGRPPLGWAERRKARRLQRAALAEATTVCCATTVQRDRLRDDYGVRPERLRLAPLAVRTGASPPSREAARRLLAVPDDVPLAVVLPTPEPAGPELLAPALEAFQRTRLIFPGARLVVVGAPEAKGASVVLRPERTLEAVAAAVAAADAAVALGRGHAVDPGLVLSLRAGVATVAPPEVDLGGLGDGAIRRVPTSDAGEVASALAELFADPALRRELGERARDLASPFDPSRLIERLRVDGALGPP